MFKKVSVIIPCHNQGEYLKNACQSVIDQTYENWEVFIIDDFSTDDTRDVSKEIVLKDPRFTYVYSENKSSAITRNDGLKLVTGDYVQFLDADDEISPIKFEESLKQDEGSDIIISNFYLFEKKIDTRIPPYCDLSKVTFDYSHILTKWDIDFSIPIHCALLKKEAISDILFNTKLKTKEDWVFWLAFFKKKPRVKFINEELAFYRVHENSKTQNKKVFYNKSIITVKHIFNSLNPEDVKLFSNRLIEDLYGEKTKSDYLYASKIELENVMFLKKTQLKRIKKAISYKVLVKLELFIRGIKKIQK